MLPAAAHVTVPRDVAAVGFRALMWTLQTPSAVTTKRRCGVGCGSLVFLSLTFCKSCLQRRTMKRLFPTQGPLKVGTDLPRAWTGAG